jgi:hypothetical protein
VTNRTYLNLALSALVLALGVAAFLTSRSQKAAPEPPLTPLSVDSINRIVIAYPAKPAITLEKTGADWSITTPVKMAADSYEVSGLLSLATLNVKSKLDAAKVKPAELGLDPPRFSITLNDVGIDFGDMAPMGGQRYVRTGGKIELVLDSNSPAANGDYSALASKSVLPTDAVITAIEGPRWKLHRGADGKSWASDPAVTGLGSGQLQGFVDHWLAARSMWNTLGTAVPPANGDSIVFDLQSGEKISLFVVARKPQLQLERPDLKLQYSLSETEVGALLQLPKPLPASAASTTAPVGH